MIQRPHIDYCYPNLRKYNYKIVKYGSPFYNCLSLANDDRFRWWDYKCNHNLSMLQTYWPPDVPQNWKTETLVLLFEKRGYRLCHHADYEHGYRKVALYMDLIGRVTHAAVMTEADTWRSKLGRFEEIEHESLDALTGIYPAYGCIAKILKRPFGYSEKQ